MVDDTVAAAAVEVSTADLLRGVEDFLNYFSFAAAILSLEQAMRSLADSRGVKSGTCSRGGVPRSPLTRSRLDDRPGERSLA